MELLYIKIHRRSGSPTYKTAIDLCNANTENHETMRFLIRQIILASLLILSCVSVQAQDCVDLYFESSKDGDDLVVELKVDNFDNILISQFALTYSFQNLELISVEGNADINLIEGHVFAEIPGYITVSWSNPSVGQTLADGTTLLELRFAETLSDIATFTVDPNFNTEFFNALFEKVCYNATPLTANESRTQLVGNLYHDLNGNCIADPTDFPLAGWTVFIDSGAEQYYRVTDEFGYYNLPVGTGSYTIEVLETNELWASCTPPVVQIVDDLGSIIENSFVISPQESSSALEVVVSSSDIAKCKNNIYSVRYKNNGTALAQSAIIEFEFDEHFEYVSTNTGSFSIDNQLITFNLGSIKPGDGGDFQVVLKADCDAIVAGQTLCVQAEISSSDITIPPIDWGGAVLTTQASCEDDSVAFVIKNIGIAPMSNSIQSIVVEDDVMFGTREVELEPQEVVKLKFAASGGVYRILIDQEDGYPLGNFTTDFVEFCNGGSTETYRYVSMFQNDDESPYIDIDCREVFDLVETNNISAYPVGYREEHLINQNEDIEYTVHFQNRGTDTVHNMYIGSFIDESLNVESLVPGPSSHDYTVSIIDERRLKIDFKNMHLPNAETDELGSKGFVKFRVSQNPNVPLGTVIKGSSVIFFELEDGIVTNEVTHLVGEEFIEIILNDKDILLDNELVVAPNPAVSSVRIQLPERYRNLSYVMYDTKGAVVSAANAPSNVFYISRDFIERGMYFLELRSEDRIIGTKKIVFQD